MSGGNRIPRIMHELIGIFDEYAKADGNRDTLTKAELKALLESEMCQMLKGAKDRASVEQVLTDLDLNGDSVVDITEFVSLVGAVTCACHGRIVKK